MTLATNEVHFAARLQRAGAPIDTVRLSSCRDREADEGREAGCLVISCHCECSFNVSTAASSTLGSS